MFNNLSAIILIIGIEILILENALHASDEIVI